MRIFKYKNSHLQFFNFSRDIQVDNLGRARLCRDEALIFIRTYSIITCSKSVGFLLCSFLLYLNPFIPLCVRS